MISMCKLTCPVIFCFLVMVMAHGCGSETGPKDGNSLQDAQDGANTTDDGLADGAQIDDGDPGQADTPSGDDAAYLDAGTDAGTDDSDDGSGDAAASDSGDSGFDAGIDGSAGDGASDAGGDQQPSGSMTVEQIGLSGMMGESALIIGPDGTSVLIDTGGDGHAAKIIEVIDRALPSRRIDWVVITHYHADHDGGFDKIFLPSSANGNDPVEIARGVISRGLFDMDADFAANDSDFQQYCNAVTDPQWDVLHYDLCNGSEECSCDGSEPGNPWPASDCDGLLLGNLEDPSDDQAGKLSYLNLGAGATMTFYNANAHLATGSGVISAEDSGISVGEGGTGPENNRSLGGIIHWGNFYYSFHGDLSSQIEDFITAHSDEIEIEPSGAMLVPPGAMDVSKLSHHGLVSSTDQAWVDWLYPDDGQNRNAIVGTDSGYWFSPSAAVMGRLEPRLGTGYIWVTRLGTMPGDNPRRKVAGGSVVIRVLEGTTYDVYALTDSGASQQESYTCTQP